MTFTVRFTEQAKADLKDTYEYIAFELGSPESAEGQLIRLQRRIEELSELPERYRRYNHEPWYTRNLCVMPVDRYLVFYISDAAQRTVTVIRIMCGGRDVHTHLNRLDNESHRSPLFQ